MRSLYIFVNFADVMGTVLFESPVFGPVQSRRLGVSLGINLMPADAKICTFDCIYCECGRNAERRSASKRPTRADVKCALELTLQKMQADGVVPNVITFAGNGEPTAHPCFAAIIDDTIELRNRYFPNAKISVLSNATRLNNDDVFQALLKVDNNIQKLDTVNPDYIKMVDCPVGNYHLPDVIDALVRFNGKVIIQTMFMKGTVNGIDVDNTGSSYVMPWIETVQKIAPEKVMIYTIDRETPVSTLEKAPKETLDRIVTLLEERGIAASASY